MTVLYHIQNPKQHKQIFALYSIVPYTIVYSNTKKMAIIKNKHITFSLVLLSHIVVSPMAKVQLGSLLCLPVINGVLFCTVNGAPLNGTSALAFNNAVVQFQCGSQNTVVKQISYHVFYKRDSDIASHTPLRLSSQPLVPAATPPSLLKKIKNR